MDESETLRWETKWQEWWKRHAMRSAEEGGLFPDIIVRKQGQWIELSWGTTQRVGIPDDLTFDEHGPAAAKVDAKTVERVLQKIVAGAGEYLSTLIPRSETDRDIEPTDKNVAKIRRRRMKNRTHPVATAVETLGEDSEEKQRMCRQHQGNARLLIVPTLDPKWREAMEILRIACIETAMRCAKALERNGGRNRAGTLHDGVETPHKLGTASRMAAQAPESAGDAWLRFGLDALSEACTILGNPKVEPETAQDAHRALEIYIAHNADGEVIVLARGGRTPTRVRIYKEGPKGFNAWLNTDASPEQWLIGGMKKPIRLSRSV